MITHPIELLACAIATQEGWFVRAALPFLRNNPGDLTYAGQVGASRGAGGGGRGDEHVQRRQWYGTAQDGIEKVLALLTSASFECNVIVISHIKYIDTPEGTKGYPTAVGSALSPVIPRYRLVSLVV